jgi:hypothetical protein
MKVVVLTMMKRLKSQTNFVRYTNFFDYFEL